MKKYFILVLCAFLALLAVGCAKNDTTKQADNTATDGKDFSKIYVAMVTDEGGINDQSFNQSAWEGLKKLQEDTKINVNYIESHKTTDFDPNFQALLEAGNNLMWGVGYKLETALSTAAKANPDKSYALIDSVTAEKLDNVVNVVFNNQEPSFLVGYIAGLMTQTDKVGFVGGKEGDIIWGFDFGFRAGVDYAAKELGKNIEVMVQYADSFSDAAKGKAIAKKFYESGADIVFHAAGGVGDGVIEAAKEANKWAIGVDRDQNYMAPDNVLTSAMKRVDNAIYSVSKAFAEGNFQGGQTLVFDLSNGGVDIAPTSDKHVPKEILEKVNALKQMIIDGKIKPPFNQQTYDEFKNTL